MKIGYNASSLHMSTVSNVEGTVGVCCLYCDIYFSVIFLIIHTTDGICGSPKITMHHFCSVFLFVCVFVFVA